MISDVPTVLPYAGSNSTTQRILDIFERQAKTVGPKRVVIAELVRELGISTKTLYRLFPNKSEMVTAMMQRHAHRRSLSQQQGLDQGRGPRARIECMALEWLEYTSQFSEQFWVQLERDFPEAHTIFTRQQRIFLQRSQENLSSAIREGLNTDVALTMLLEMIVKSTDTEYCERLNITRRDALSQAINIWSVGALREEAVKLS